MLYKKKQERYEKMNAIQNFEDQRSKKKSDRLSKILDKRRRELIISEKSKEKSKAEARSPGSSLSKSVKRKNTRKSKKLIQKRNESADESDLEDQPRIRIVRPNQQEEVKAKERQKIRVDVSKPLESNSSK